jgi:hypothetical protein
MASKVWYCWVCQQAVGLHPDPDGCECENCKTPVTLVPRYAADENYKCEADLEIKSHRDCFRKNACKRCRYGVEKSKRPKKK